jgi:Fe2+ transport system protein B
MDTWVGWKRWKGGNEHNSEMRKFGLVKTFIRNVVVAVGYFLYSLNDSRLIITMIMSHKVPCCSMLKTVVSFLLIYLFCEGCIKISITLRREMRKKDAKKFNHKYRFYSKKGTTLIFLKADDVKKDIVPLFPCKEEACER